MLGDAGGNRGIRFGFGLPLLFCFHVDDLFYLFAIGGAVIVFYLLKSG